MPVPTPTGLAMAKNNLHLLSNPHGVRDTNTPMAHSTLALADETCRLYPQQSVDLFLRQSVDRYHPDLPIDAYPYHPAAYPHLARVANDVAHRRSHASTSKSAITNAVTAEDNAFSADNQGCHRWMHNLYQAASEIERGSSSSDSSSSEDTEVANATRRQGHSALNGSFAAGNKRHGATANKPDIVVPSPRPNKRTRPATEDMHGRSATPKRRNPPAPSPATGYVPVVAAMENKRRCPKAPRGQRDTAAYKKEVSEWIMERTKGTKLSKVELDTLLVNNVMRGKVYMLHPCNDMFDEETNLDPELWSTYTEWGKTLVPEIAVYNRLSKEEKEQLYDWPDRDLWKALFIIWLRDYTDRHTRVVWYRQCWRCQRGGWPCMVAHEMFGKTDIKHKPGKKGGGAGGCACIPCRVSKAECSHSKLMHPLEEAGWGMSDLKAYWDGKLTLTELFARRQRSTEEVGPFDTDNIPSRINAEEDASFDAVVKLEKARKALPPIASRTTLTQYHREARESRATRRAEREKFLAGERVLDMKKLAMVKYLAQRLHQGTLSAPMYPWKDFERTMRDLPATNSHRRDAGQQRIAAEDVAPYPDFHVVWTNGVDSFNTRHPPPHSDNALPGPSTSRARRSSRSQHLSRSRELSSSSAAAAPAHRSSSPSQFFQDESTPALDNSRSPTVPLLRIVTPHLPPGPLPADGPEYAPGFSPPASPPLHHPMAESAPTRGSVRLKRRRSN